MSIKQLRQQIAKIKSSLSYSTDSGACKLAKKYDPCFNGDTYDALEVINKGIREEAEKYRKEAENSHS